MINFVFYNDFKLTQMLNELIFGVILLAVTLLFIFNWTQILAIFTCLALSLMQHDFLKTACLWIAVTTVWKLAAYLNVFIQYLLNVSVYSHFLFQFFINSMFTQKIFNSFIVNHVVVKDINKQQVFQILIPVYFSSLFFIEKWVITLNALLFEKAYGWPVLVIVSKRTTFAVNCLTKLAFN